MKKPPFSLSWKKVLGQKLKEMLRQHIVGWDLVKKQRLAICGGWRSRVVETIVSNLRRIEEILSVRKDQGLDGRIMIRIKDQIKDHRSGSRRRKYIQSQLMKSSLQGCSNIYFLASWMNDYINHHKNLIDWMSHGSSWSLQLRSGLNVITPVKFVRLICKEASVHASLFIFILMCKVFHKMHYIRKIFMDLDTLWWRYTLTVVWTLSIYIKH